MGLIYNLGEPNSVATIAKTKPALDEQNIEYVEHRDHPRRGADGCPEADQRRGGGDLCAH